MTAFIPYSQYTDVLSALVFSTRYWELRTLRSESKHVRNPEMIVLTMAALSRYLKLSRSSEALTLLLISHCYFAAKAVVAITATKAAVGDKVLMLKKNLDEAITSLDNSGEHSIKHILVSEDDTACAYMGRDIHLEKVSFII